MSERKRVKPKELFVTVKADSANVDIEVKILRGGTLNLGLSDGPETDKPFRFDLPGGLRDQRQWICDAGGMRPARPEEEW